VYACVGEIVRYVCIEERLEKRRTGKGRIQGTKVSHTHIQIDVHTLGHCVALLVGEVWLTGTVKCRPLVEEEARKKERWRGGGQCQGGGGGDEH
jgi:hypothetical protein